LAERPLPPTGERRQCAPYRSLGAPLRLAEPRSGRAPPIRDDAKRDRGDADAISPAGKALERLISDDHDEPQEEAETQSSEGPFLA